MWIPFAMLEFSLANLDDQMLIRMELVKLG